MRFKTEFLERAPLLWLLLGLLMFSGGLYLGFDHALTFVYMLVGLFCSLYGPLLYVFKVRERGTRSSARPLSRDFISAGATVIMPAEKNDPEELRMAAERTVQA